MSNYNIEWSSILTTIRCDNTIRSSIKSPKSNSLAIDNEVFGDP